MSNFTTRLTTIRFRPPICACIARTGAARDCVETLSEFLNRDENNKKRKKYKPSSQLFIDGKPEVGEKISHRKNPRFFTQSGEWLG